MKRSETIKEMERRFLTVVEAYDRPRTRSDCENSPRPCPFVGCRHHLYLEVGDNGTIWFNFPGLEPSDLKESCSLDFANRGGAILEEVATALNVTRERVRQMEFKALRRIKVPTQRFLK